MAQQNSMPREVRFTLPPTVADLLGREDETLASHARERVILSLYQSGEIGPGVVIEVLGLTHRDFLDALARHGLPLLEYEEGELEDEVDAAEAFLRKRPS